MTTMLVISNLPDQASAERLARHLIETRTAACVNILAPCRSVYRWDGAVEEATEIPVLMKTTRERYSDLETAIRSLHPYELPEIIAVEVGAGLPAYLSWVAQETQAAARSDPAAP